MEKYSVQQDHPPESEKTSSDRRTCPLCGKEADVKNGVWLCPVHGSRPWERSH